VSKIKNICVYCGSSGNISASHQKLGENLGTSLGKNGYKLIYGGGTWGLMGVVARAAFQAGGQVLGIMPELFTKYEDRMDSPGDLRIVSSMSERKQLFYEKSDAFCALPGGVGTFDELFETLVLKSLGLLDKPVVLLDDGTYWQPFQGLVDHMLAHNFIRPDFLKLYTVVSSVEAAMDAFHAPVCSSSVCEKWKNHHD
jgi:uncharacterized protein (TIGR00730 family)